MSDTLIDGVDYGPLAGLVGTWKGDDGLDVAPEPDGDEHNPYYETIEFEAAGDVTNAEEQVLAIVRYHQVVSRKSNDEVFHDQIGYWLWDKASDLIIQTLVIPRAVSLQAAGHARDEGGAMVIEVQAGKGDIVQSPFMAEKARTTAFRHRVTLAGDTLTYNETSVLEIYDKAHYEHTDGNILHRT